MDKNQSVLVSTLFPIISLFYSVQSFAQLPSYTITELPLSGVGTSLQVREINNHGEVVGSFIDPQDGTSHAFVFRNGSILDIKLLLPSGVTTSLARRINDSSLVVGVSVETSTLQGFIWSPSSGLTLTDEGDNFYGLSNNNDIVGHSGVLGESAIWSNGWNSNPTPLYQQQTEIQDVNESGTIIGSLSVTNSTFDAIRGDINGFDILSTPINTDSAIGIAINDSDQAIGYTQLGLQKFAWLWEADGSRVNIDFTARPPSNNIIYNTDLGSDINSQGIVVGQSWFSDSQTERAVRWDSINGAADLNDLVVNLDGWDYLNYAASISDTGYITGVGYKDDGAYRAFVLTPSNLTPPPIPAEIIVDNNAECVGPVAAWIPINYDILFFIPGSGANWQQTSGLANAYGVDYHQLLGSDNDGTPEFQWIFEVATTGTYEVDAWWPEDNNSTATANYVVIDQNGDTLMTVAQNTNGGQWNSLGFYNFNAGTIYKVKLSAPSGEPVLADSIRISN